MTLPHTLCRSRCAGARWHASLVPTLARSSKHHHSWSGRVQSYVSASHDPFLNLSIEHYLLQTSPPSSAVLFLYVNRPSIIIGRNQNPWLEVNLALLNSPYRRPRQFDLSGLGAVDLVRRRSGGGTVFHDEGNVNWTIISPSEGFTRDKHAELVVRALRNCGVDRARVNARHDIVLDQGKRQTETDSENTHTTPYEAVDFDTPRPLKVSGSAYKLTRNRALHHGTCLLSSPNLDIIPEYLHSPAKSFITARGVESVSSPVGNAMLSSENFIAAVQRSFEEHYPTSDKLSTVTLGEELLQFESVRQGYEELKSPKWMYLQTPQFSLSTGSQGPPDISLELTARYGAVTSALLRFGESTRLSPTTRDLSGRIIGHKIHQIRSWKETLDSNLNEINQRERDQLLEWLETMLPRLQEQE